MKRRYSVEFLDGSWVFQHATETEQQAKEHAAKLRNPSRNGGYHGLKVRIMDAVTGKQVKE
jgi:hypothetical protein